MIQMPVLPPPPPPRLTVDNYRYPGEGSALAVSVILLAIIAFLFLAISLGTAVVILVLGLVLIRLRQSSLIGNSIPVTDRNYPRIWNLLCAASGRLWVPMPRTHVVQDPALNAFSIGFSQPYSIVLNSALVDTMQDDELLFIIGHESGHILAGHTVWLSLIAPLGTTIPGFDFIFGFWQRKSEYTADRTALLVVRDIGAAVRALVKAYCGPRALEHLDLQGALGQTTRAGENDLTHQLGEMLGTHPYLTNRIRELILFDRQHRISAGPQQLVCPCCKAVIGPGLRFCGICGAQVTCSQWRMADSCS